MSRNKHQKFGLIRVILWLCFEISLSKAAQLNYKPFDNVYQSNDFYDALTSINLSVTTTRTSFDSV